MRRSASTRPVRAIVIANGRLRVSPTLRARLARADLVICADGGLRAAAALRLRPHIVIGDFDSIPADLLRWAGAEGARVIRYPTDKDKTDTELALDAAVARGASDVEFVGVMGHRADHTLANVMLLIQAERRGVRARVLDGREELLLAERMTRLAGAPGDRVSLIPMSERVGGVTLTGLKYPLRHHTLRRGSTLGVSNEIVGRRPTVRILSGLLLIVLEHRSAQPR